MIDPSNRNTLWASIMVDELARCGVRHAVIAPGSRSTPLAVAFSREERIKVYSIIDERAAAFFALGIGKASGMPAVVVCTSGTAAANLYPAIIEASESNVPLIVMTADRPHELRDSGANQTIDQVKMFGGFVRWFVDVAPPHANPEDRTLRYLRTTIDRAVAYAQGANGGPVHLNIPFEKPLEPVVVEGDVQESELSKLGVQGRPNESRFTNLERHNAKTTEQDVELLVMRMAQAPHGIIVFGPRTSVGIMPMIFRVAEAMGYPILADGLSNYRLTRCVDEETCVLGGYETYLRAEFAASHKAQLILYFGDPPVGTSLLNYIESQVEADHIWIGEGRAWADHSYLLTHHIETSLVSMTYDLASWMNLRIRRTPADPKWLSDFQTADVISWQAIDEIHECKSFEGMILQNIVDLIPLPGARLFVANSNPVRHLDQFVRPWKLTRTPQIHIDANRGVSGIDGTIATALGVAGITPPKVFPTILVIGDLALYHDLNSLHLIRRLDIPLVIVCINNDGGGIFHRLPIAQHEPPFRDLFVTPHGLTFEHAAKMFDIPYTLAQMGEDFRSAFRAALDSGEPHLIEVPSDAAVFERQRRELIDTVARRIEEAGILDNWKETHTDYTDGMDKTEKKSV